MNRRTVIYETEIIIRRLNILLFINVFWTSMNISLKLLLVGAETN